VAGSAASAKTFRGLPPFVADSLPDAFGTAVVDAFLARRGSPVEAANALHRLVFVGRQGLGALEFFPLSQMPVANGPLSFDLLAAAARDVLSGAAAGGASPAFDSLFAVGRFAGGAKPKAIVEVHDDGRIRSGLHSPEPGWTDFILTLDGIGNDRGRSDGETRVEYAYHLMAGAAGIDVPRVGLVEEGGRAHFLSRRFDREPASDPNDAPRRLHLQSLCAMRGLDYRLADTHDYGAYLATIRDLGLGDHALRQGFRRAAFNVFAYNRDDHTKNHAFLMDRTGTWRLAPAYDLTFAFRPDSVSAARHLMGVDGVFGDPTRADLERLGQRWGVPAIGDTLDEVKEAISRWGEFADEAGVSPERRDGIAAVLAF
jgi:serine/threonine-protein kinase HipA